MDLGRSGSVVVKTYRDVLAAYGVHPEAKSLGPDGAPCGRRTRSLLRRRRVDSVATIYIGKESNRLEEVEAGAVHDLADVLAEYPDPRRDPWVSVVLPVLRDAPRAVLADAAGIHPRTVAAVRNGRQTPRRGTAARLIRAAAAFAGSRLRSVGIPAPVDHLAACRAYLAQKSRET